MILGVRVGAIVAAGGSGQRAGLAKQWLELGGETVLRRSARLLADCALVDELVLVVPPGEEARALEALAGLGKPGVAVAGGPARADSVRNGLAALPGCGVVLVHDAARPFASPGLVARVAEAAARDGAALAALAVTDTVKRAGAGDPPRVAATLDRRELWLAQTPQGFTRELLLRAYAEAGQRLGGSRLLASGDHQHQLIDQRAVGQQPGRAAQHRLAAQLEPLLRRPGPLPGAAGRHDRTYPLAEDHPGPPPAGPRPGRRWHLRCKPGPQ